MEAQARIKKLIRYHFLGLSLFVLAGLVIILSSGWQKEAEEVGGPTPLAQGRQVYSIMSGPSEGPTITQVVIDPFDPKIGEQQAVTITVTRATGASVAVHTDHGSKTFALQKKSAEGNEEIWEGTWETEDTHDVMYGMAVVATGEKGESRADLSFR